MTRMSVLTFLGNWFGGGRPQRRRHGPRRGGALPRHAYRPVLEVLEDRLPPGTLLGNGLSGPVLGLSPFAAPDSGLTSPSGSSTKRLSVVSGEQTTSTTKTSPSTGTTSPTGTSSTTTTTTTTATTPTTSSASSS